MRTVWKFPVTTVESFVEMPKDAQIIHVTQQRGVTTIWAVVETTAPKVTRHFYSVGTGEEIPFQFNTHRGTCFEAGYVWHLFENTLPQ